MQGVDTRQAARLEFSSACERGSGWLRSLGRIREKMKGVHAPDCVRHSLELEMQDRARYPDDFSRRDQVKDAEHSLSFAANARLRVIVCETV